MRDPFRTPPLEGFLPDDADEATSPGRLMSALARAGIHPKADSAVVSTMRASKKPPIEDATASGVCGGCGETCWVSPSSADIASRPGTILVCEECVAPVIFLRGILG